MTPFINMHTHQTANNKHNNIYIVSLTIDEWQDSKKNNFVSVGIHPYQSSNSTYQQQLVLLEAILQQPNTIAVGEVGLDRHINIPIATQTKVLRTQLALAKQYKKPIIFHAVRTIPDILSICKQESVNLPLIFHGFTGKPEAVEQIHRAGGYTSFGAKLLTNRSWDTALKKAYELGCLFFETDEANIAIESVYSKAAEVLATTADSLKSQVYSYFCSVFKDIDFDANMR